ncbi:MAG: hypothetical protein ACJ75I_05745 [Solirubrobacterales bacterium]
MRERAIAVALLVALTIAAAGCGDGGSTTRMKSGPVESAQKLPKLPSGWKPHTDRTIGYVIGVPTGWKVSDSSRRALLRSPDHLVAVTLTADRDPRTFRRPLNEFATQALGALPGFKVPLEPSKPKPFKGTPLIAVATTASGAQAGGLKETATLVVLRRDHLVNYTVAILENAEQPGAALDRAVALRMIQTLRDVPPKESATK